MPVGKILTEKRSNLKNIDWYDSFHTYTDYKVLDDMGLDINFNKHFCHGLELRIFDSITINDLKDILYFIVHLADFSLDIQLENPKLSQLWQKITEKCVHNGRGYFMDVSDQNELYKILRICQIFMNESDYQYR